MPTCRNCEKEFDGKYCPNCGQKATVKRITVQAMFTDLAKKLFPWDEGFLYTSRTVLLRPGPTVRAYLEGRRASHSKPLSFLGIVVALSLILIPQEELTTAMMAGQKDPRLQKLANWLASNMTVVFVLMIPFLALFSRWFFRRADVNYAEHAVLNAYVVGGMSIISIPVYFIFKWLGYPLNEPVGYTLQSVFFLAFYVWAYVQFFRPANPVWVGIKSVLVYVLGSMFYFFLAGFIGIILILIFSPAGQ
jgi:hypothetical protein